MLSATKKRKSERDTIDEDVPGAKRRKTKNATSVLKSLLGALSDEDQLDMRDYFLARYPIYDMELAPWSTRLWFLDQNEEYMDSVRRVKFLMTLISDTILKTDDKFAIDHRITGTRGIIAMTTRLIEAIAAFSQATHFFLAEGDEIESRSIMERANDGDEDISVTSYKTFACETEEYAEQFMDREDYEFFRDHCHKWSPEKFKQVISDPRLIPGDAPEFNLNIGAINKYTEKVVVLTLEFKRMIK